MKGQQGKLQAVLVRGTRYTLLMGTLACTMMTCFAEPAMRLWLQRSLGTDYSIVAEVLILWALADLLTYASGTQWPVLVGMQRLRFMALTKIPQAALNVGLSVFLVGYAGMGVLGVVIPTLALRAIPVCYFYSLHGAALQPYWTTIL